MFTKIRAASAGAALVALAATGMASGTASATPAAAASTAKATSCWGGYFATGNDYIRGRYGWCPNGRYWAEDLTYDGYAVQVVINGKRCTASGSGHKNVCHISPKKAKWMYKFLVRGNHSKYLGRVPL